MTETQPRVINGDINHETGPVNVKTGLIINGSVLDNTNVFATEDIIIRGFVNNAVIESSGGDICVDKGISGEKTKIKAFGDIRTPFIRNAQVKCSGSAYVSDVIFNATLKAKNIVEMHEGEGLIDESYVEAGVEISVKKIGSFDHGKTHVSLENFRQKELFEISLIYTQKLRQKKFRMSELEKVIDIIKILGSRISNLSHEKKHDLALKVKEYNELKVKIAKIKKEYERILSEKNQSKNIQRSIIAAKDVHPGVEVKIDNARLKVTKIYNGVIFYKSGIIIIGDLDSFTKRKRLIL